MIRIKKNIIDYWIIDNWSRRVSRDSQSGKEDFDLKWYFD